MKPKILIVDDEEGIRKVLSISLSDAGYQVFTAPGGLEALEIIKESRPEIVLSDIRMPGMDGIALLSEIKRQSPETEVVMITGHGDMELAIQSLQRDAADFVVKPIRDDHLEVALKRAEERYTLRKSLAEHTAHLERLVAEKTRKLLLSERLAAVGETVAALSHTIRNLAGGLSGGMFVLEKGIELGNHDYLTKGFSMIRGNAAQISKLSLDLLSFAKSAQVETEPWDVNEPAREAFAASRDRFARAGVTLAFTPLSDTRTLPMDAEGLRLCLQNLLDNALEACGEQEEGKQPDTVTLSVCRSENCGICYCVADTGCGMDPGMQKRLFSGFFSTKGSKGTGIGLMLVKNIVERHGGSVEFSSRINEGSRFLIRLPDTAAGNAARKPPAGGPQETAP
ncbi:MAG: response regulator [Thermodesulfobacteriota bacterium]